MSEQVAARRVQLVIASDVVSPDEMSEVLGRPDRATWAGKLSASSVLRRPAVDNSWELRESGNASADVSGLIENLIKRVEPIVAGVRGLREKGCRVILSVVLYVSVNDEIGPGFFISKNAISLLANIGATFEVDHYFDD